MKKRISFLLAALTAVLLFASCGGYEVKLGIGDGSAADDAVTVSFTLPEKIKDGFTLSCRFSAEKAANLDGSIVFALASADPLFADSYTEKVLYRFSGSELAALKRSDGSCGDLRVDVNFGTLSDILAAESGTFCLVLHREDADRTDITAWNSSSYGYTRTGGTAQITKD